MNAITASPAINRADFHARVIWMAVTILVPLAGAAWIAAGEPAGPECLLRATVHVDCPTCGMTRALALLLRGDWRASLALHPGTAALLLETLAGWVLWTRWLFLGGRNFERRIPWIVLGNAAALIALWVVRLATGTLPG